jgi:hypothetical protein
MRGSEFLEIVCPAAEDSKTVTAESETAHGSIGAANLDILRLQQRHAMQLYVPSHATCKPYAAACRGSTSTKGPVGWDNSAPEYIIKDNMRGYSSRGNVFVRPTPDVPTEPQAPTIVGAAPVALAGAAKKVTGLFATAKQKIWRALTAPFRKAEPTYMGYIAEGKGWLALVQVTAAASGMRRLHPVPPGRQCFCLRKCIRALQHVASACHQLRTFHCVAAHRWGGATAGSSASCRLKQRPLTGLLLLSQQIYYCRPS